MKIRPIRSLMRVRRWLARRLAPATEERVGRETNYNLYRLHPWLRLTSKGAFLSDESPRFPAWLEQIRRRGCQKALILGNAPCLSELSEEKFEGLRDAGYFTIGINRSIYTHQTDVLIWSDLKAMHDVLSRRAIRTNRTTALHVRHERDHRLPAPLDRGFQALHEYWSEHRNFRDWPKSKLYMFRNSAVSALNLCYRLGIKDIVMIGFGFDDRGYFYETDRFKGAEKYELISDKKLQENCGGYTTQRIVGEVLEYLIADEGFRVRYNGDSEFLRGFPGMERITVDAL